MNDKFSAVQKHKAVVNTTSLVNKHLKQIAKNIKIDKSLTTYTARHSYATVLKRKGVSVEFISEALGHTDIRTTENYLDSFEDETKKDVAKILTDFGNTNKSVS